MPGASGTASVTAGVPAFLTTNVNRGTGGANGTTSGTGLLDLLTQRLLTEQLGQSQRLC